MLSDEQKKFILDLLTDLEYQVNEGEYYSYDRDNLNEHIEAAKKLFGIEYVPTMKGICKLVNNNIYGEFRKSYEPFTVETDDILTKIDNEYMRQEAERLDKQILDILRGKTQ